MQSRTFHSRSGWQWLLGMFAAAAVALVVTTALRKDAPAPAAADQPAPKAAPEADVAIPPAVDSDSRIREILSALSPSQVFQRWLQEDELLDRLVVSTVNIAEDASPTRSLSFLRPSRRFTATRSGTGMVMSAGSAARYDVFVKVVSSLDDRQVASAYRTLHPLLESAYHALGYPGRPLDEVVTRALQRIVDAPIRDQVAVRRSGRLWVFADPRLESAGAVEKQLLRMGSRNTRLLQEEARSIAGALGLRLHGGLQAATR
jgi:hypothetical protein